MTGGNDPRGRAAGGSADGPARSNHKPPRPSPPDPLTQFWARAEHYGVGRADGAGTRYAVAAGMGLLRDDGEELGVTQVSSGGADDGGPPRADSRPAQARPSFQGCRLSVEYMF